MKFDQTLCPVCGEPPRGTVETLSGVAELTGPDEDSHFEYGGYTDVWWDEQKTVRDSQNRVQLICHNGHDWFTQLHEDAQ